MYVCFFYIYIACTTRRTLCFYYKDQSMNGVWRSKCSLFVSIIYDIFRLSLRTTSHLPVNTNSKQTVHEATDHLTFSAEVNKPCCLSFTAQYHSKSTTDSFFTHLLITSFTDGEATVAVTYFPQSREDGRILQYD